MEKLYLPRELEAKLLDYQTYFPAVVVIGPRQVGKTSLVRALRNQLQRPSVYLDLERPRDLAAVEDLEYFVQANPDCTIILDEVQRKPTLFPELRSVIDENRQPGRFVLLGSASLDLIRDASETLAGRIAILELTGLTYREISSIGKQATHWLRGGFPDSFLAPNDDTSAAWREFFVRTYLERDLSGFGPNFNPALMQRVLTMLAHLNGQLLNYQLIRKSLDVDDKTVARYVQFLEQTFLIRLLPPYYTNASKRLVKTAKLYFRDTGILHFLNNIETTNTLLSHPGKGASFEAYVIEQLASQLPRRTELNFYRTANKAEIDILVTRNGLPHAAVEVKSSASASPARGFYTNCEALRVERRYLVAPGDQSSGGDPTKLARLAVSDLDQILA